MAISIVPYIGLCCFTTQFLYPVYESLRTVVQDSPASAELAQWTFFWVLCALYALLESYLLFWAVDYVPLYLEMKTLAFLWLVHPYFRGAAFLWFSKLAPLHRRLEEEHQLQEKLLQALGPLGAQAQQSATDGESCTDAAQEAAEQPRDMAVPEEQPSEAEAATAKEPAADAPAPAAAPQDAEAEVEAEAAEPRELVPPQQEEPVAAQQPQPQAEEDAELKAPSSTTTEAPGSPAASPEASDDERRSESPRTERVSIVQDRPPSVAEAVRRHEKLATMNSFASDPSPKKLSTMEAVQGALKNEDDGAVTK